MKSNSQECRYIRWFDEIGISDVPTVGGKNASLGELYRELVPQGINVPNGFAITAEAYWDLLSSTTLEQRLKNILTGLDTGDMDNLRRRGSAIRHEITGTPLPEPLQQEILSAYRRLSAGAGGPVDVAVRSSATAEDLPDASFAGQQETYLNVQGNAALLDSCKRCFASLFTDRAISYRQDKGFDNIRVGLSIGVQRMVRSDLAASGVMFSIDTETGCSEIVLINAAYGLGENVVQGTVNPDEYYVFKPTLKQGFRPIPAKSRRHERIETHLRYRRRQDGQEHAGCCRRPRALCDWRRRHPHLGPLGLPDRRPLQSQTGPLHANGHGVG